MDSEKTQGQADSGHFVILQAYTAALPDRSDVPACPSCRTTKFVVALVDQKDGITTGITCENGHSWLPEELIRISLWEAVKAEKYAGVALGQAIDMWVHEFSREIAGSSDRAAAILSGAMLDKILELLIMAFCIDEEKASRRLLGPDRPLGTFAARIHFCYFFGLISEREWRALKIIKDIRNGFAHELGNLSFDDERMMGRARSVIQILQLRGGEQDSARGHFVAGTATLWSSLAGKLSLVRRSARMPFEPTAGAIQVRMPGNRAENPD